MNKDISNTSIPALRKPKCMANEEKSKESPYLANGKQNEAFEVRDPKKIEFSRLVELLNPKIVHEYLELILNFLTQGMNEMRFPDIAPYKAAFLERIVTNPSNLRCECFNESSKIVISKIINVLEKNKCIFKWTFAYENKTAKSVLTYRKQSLFDELSLKPRSSQVPTNDTEVPMAFKRLWLSNTLQFTKDDNRLKLVYPHTPRHFKDFITSLVWDPNKVMNIDAKVLCGPLWEAMRIFGLKYEFRLTSQDVDSETLVMVLEKIPKNASKNNEKAQIVEQIESQKSLFLKPADRLAAVGSPRSQDGEIKCPPQIPVQKAVPLPTKKADQKALRIIQSLSSQFLTRVLKEFLEFVEDQQQASLLFLSTTPNEAEFLQKMVSLVKTSASLDLFPSEHQLRVKKITLALEKRSAMIVDVKFEKMQKKTKLRDVKFLKTIKHLPIRTLGPPKQLPLEAPDAAVSGKTSTSTLPAPAPPSRQKGNLFLEALYVSSEDLDNDKVNNEKRSNGDPERSPESQPSRPGSVTKSVTKSKILLDLTDQSVHSGQSSNRSSSRDGLSKAKQKMLEALSVPVQCDKAERMMMLMGWQGGALGARGEGITEPILPALQIKAGAGFGHVAATKPSKPARSEPPVKVSSEFRITFMQHVARLITSEAEDFTLEYDEPVTDKERFFINSYLKSCNRRREHQLGTKEEMDMVRSIIEQLCDTPIGLNVTVSKDRRTVKVTKRKRPDLITMHLTSKIAAKQTAKRIEEHGHRDQSDKYFKIKMELLKRIVNFVKGDCKRFVINIKEKHPVHRFYNMFFESVVAMANRNVPIVYQNLTDYELYKGLVEAVNGFCLEFSFEDNGEQRFILSKRHRKRFINSALEGPSQNVNSEDNNKADEITIFEFGIDNDDTDEGTSLSEDKSCQSNINNCDKTHSEKENHKTEAEIDYKTDTEKDFDDFEEKKDLKVDIYEDDWLNCCDSVTTNENVKVECDTETNNNYVKTNNYMRIEKNDNKSRNISESAIEDEDFKTVHILPSVYPNEKVDTEFAMRIQNALLDKLKTEVSLPKLQCFGIQNDVLVYNCRNENTYLFLTDFVEKSDLNLKLVDFKPVTPLTYKVEFKINSLIQNKLCETLVNFELYNNGLKTDKWEVLEVVVKENCSITTVIVDSGSYKYICDKRFCLDLGFDRALFRLVW